MASLTRRAPGRKDASFRRRASPEYARNFRAVLYSPSRESRRPRVLFTRRRGEYADVIAAYVNAIAEISGPGNSREILPRQDPRELEFLGSLDF